MKLHFRQIVFFACYRPKRSFGQGNIFTSVCHSVHRGGLSGPGGGLSGPGGCLVPGGGVWSGPGGFSKFSGGGLHRNTVNVRPVRILLECILVLYQIRVIIHYMFSM